LNMTSNETLMTDIFCGIRAALDPSPQRALRVALEAGLNVTLSTDDDGIWLVGPCQHGHASVAFEFCKAARAGCFKSVGEMLAVVKAGEAAAFTKYSGDRTLPDNLQELLDDYLTKRKNDANLLFPFHFDNTIALQQLDFTLLLLIKQEFYFSLNSPSPQNRTFANRKSTVYFVFRSVCDIG
jgi:hypothetical protein